MKKILLTVLLPVILLVVTIHSSPAKAASIPVTGYAWSPTIGWIQFATGVSSPVTIDDTTGNWSGYAWSSNIGWIQFGGLGTSPLGGSSNANISMTTGAVTGWARALAGVGRTDGWDGWIELTGANHSVTYDQPTGNFGGYAWGGPVVGWVQFGTSVPVNANPSSGPVITAASCSPSVPTFLTGPGNVTFTSSAPSGGTGSFEYNWGGGVGTWSSSNSTSISYGVGTSPGPILVVRNSGDTSGGSNFTASPNCGSVNVLAAPVVSSADIKIARNTASLPTAGTTLVVNQGRNFVIGWDATAADDYSATVAIIGPDGNTYSHASLSPWTTAAVNGTGVDNGDGTKTWTNMNPGISMTAGTLASPMLPGQYKFRITFDNGGGTPMTVEATLRVVQTTEVEV